MFLTLFVNVFALFSGIFHDPFHCMFALLLAIPFLASELNRDSVVEIGHLASRGVPIFYLSSNKPPIVKLQWPLLGAIVSQRLPGADTNIWYVKNGKAKTENVRHL